MRRILLIIMALLPILAFAQSPKKAKWNFNNLEGWMYSHQDNNPEKQCEIEKGKLKITTLKGSRDRKKMHTKDRIYTTGRYTWRTYISEMGQGDQTCIGSWIYCDDKHEIDFEVGPGNEQVRKQLNAQPDDMVVYMTTQGNPYHTTTATLKPGWHIFELDITSVDGKYKVTWLIDGKVKSTIQQTFGTEIAFYIFCSVENLTFLGSHPATQDNYGMFDYVKYKYHK